MGVGGIRRVFRTAYPPFSSIAIVFSEHSDRQDTLHLQGSPPLLVHIAFWLGFFGIWGVKWSGFPRVYIANAGVPPVVGLVIII